MLFKIFYVLARKIQNILDLYSKENLIELNFLFNEEKVCPINKNFKNYLKNFPFKYLEKFYNKLFFFLNQVI